MEKNKAEVGARVDIGAGGQWTEPGTVQRVEGDMAVVVLDTGVLLYCNVGALAEVKS